MDQVSRDSKKTEVIEIYDTESDLENATKEKCHKRKRRRPHKRKVKVDTSRDTETLVITQKVKGKNQKFKCIINLTNIRDHVGRRKTKTCLKGTDKDRIVPHCLRQQCVSAIASKCCKRMHKKGRSKGKKRSKRVKKERKLSTNSLSSISSQELEEVNNNISYESISSDSLTIYSENEMDTLIKRTKDREKEQSRERIFQEPLSASTPIYVESASDIENATTQSDQSVATLVLETDIYSPINQTNDVLSYEEANDIDYSPKSFDNNITFPNATYLLPTSLVKDKNIQDSIYSTVKCFETNVKDEPCVKNEISSPLNNLEACNKNELGSPKKCALGFNVKTEMESPNNLLKCLNEENKRTNHIDYMNKIIVKNEKTEFCDGTVKEPLIVNVKSEKVYFSRSPKRLKLETQWPSDFKRSLEDLK